MFSLWIMMNSCNKDSIDPDKIVFSVQIQAAREAEQIKIQWNLPLVLNSRSSNFYNPNVVSADRWELYVSENDTLNFAHIDEFDKETNEYYYSKNVPGKNYFFKIKSSAKGASPSYSNIAWIMGGENRELEVIVDGVEDNTLQFWDVSEDENKLLYSKNVGELCCDNISLFTKDLKTNLSELLIAGEQGSFRTKDNTIAFVSHFGITKPPQPTNLGGLPIHTNESTQLTNDDNVIQFPVWSDNRNDIFFLNVDGFNSNPWTLQKYQLDNQITETLISSHDITITKQPISTNENKIYFTTYEDFGQEGINVYDLEDKSVNVVEQTIWSEYGPAISPDGLYLAFISNRSGRDEIWVKEINTRNYFQVSADFGVYPQGKVVWSSESERLYFKGFYNEKHAIVKVQFNSD